jgi:hypothetical protein
MQTPSKPILTQIREAARFVSKQAQHVRIQEHRLTQYAESLSIDKIIYPEIDWNHHFEGTEEETATFFIILDTINFGSGFFPHLKKRPGLSGYFTIATHLTDHFRNHGPITPQTLSVITAKDCIGIFGQSEDDPVVGELMGLFAKALNDLGEFIRKRHHERFSRFIESAEGSAEKLVVLLSEMPFFRDVQSYRGKDIPFFKRAQLMAADLSCCFKKNGLGRFDDLDRLTIFADNLVPHVLRMDGILRYDRDLESRIDREILIPKNSPEEIEMRACALDAVEQMVQHLRGRRDWVTAMGIDYLLWNKGQSPYYKKTKPRHRTRTVFY